MESYAPPAPQGLTWLIAVSLVVHAGVFAAAFYVSSLKPRRPLDLKAIPVELVALGKPRDERLLPRKVERQPAAAPQAARKSPAQTEPAPKDAVALDATKTEKKPRASRRTSEPELSDAAQRLLDGAKNRRLDEALKKLERSGRADGSPLGTTTDPKNLANAYEAKVKALLQNRYQLPLTVPPSQRRFLVAEVVLFVDRRGRIRRYEFLERHPNQAFMSALEGLLKSTELPPPPAALAAGYANDGLAIRFKP